MAKINPTYPSLDYLQIDGTTKLLLQGTFEGVPPIVAELFSKGCVVQNVTAATVLVNTGTSAVPVWTAL